MKSKLTLLLTSLLFTSAQGAYTYIDATPTNTTLDGVALVAGSNYVNDGSSGSGTDNLWTYRTGVSGFENTNYFESDGGSVTGDREGTGNLVTSITLPVAGTYDIVAMFTRTSNRDIAARLGSAPTTADIFTVSNALNASQSVDPLEIDFDSSYTDARTGNGGAAYLGQFTTTVPNQSIQIYINGFDSLTGTQDERTQFDGIGFQLVPEPGSALLGLLGSVLLIRRRRQ